jgi:hypothetical protein
MEHEKFSRWHLAIIYHRFAKLIKRSNRTRRAMASNPARTCGTGRWKTSIITGDRA